MFRGGSKSASHSSSYNISNAVDYPLLGLSLYGKSTQDGVPTPENPVEIISVGDNGFDIITKNDNHFNLLSVRDNGGEIITKQPVSAVGKVDTIIGITVAATATGLKYQWQYSTDKGQTWKNSSSTGNNSPTISLTISPTWNGVHLRCVITDENGNAEISNDAVIYAVSDDCEINTASITASVLPLCGIPVESGGTYTDSNGQQWICDELIYNADGTCKIIKKIGNIIFDGSEDWSKSGSTEIDRYIFRNVSAKKGIRITSGLCDTYIVDASETSDTELGKILLYPTYYDQISVNFAEYGTSTVETFKDYLKNNPIVLCTDLIEPQEIELTATEMTALRQLQMFDGVTSISNSAGADMDVKFCTNKMLSECVLPITTGLQKQLGTIYRTLNNKPALIFDGNIPTSSSAGYAEFTIDKEHSALIIVPICNESNVYEPGACTVIPIGYITEEEQGFAVYGYPRAVQRLNRPFIKRIGNTIYVRSQSTSCNRMIIYGI